MGSSARQSKRPGKQMIHTVPGSAPVQNDQWRQNEAGQCDIDERQEHGVNVLRGPNHALGHAGGTAAHFEECFFCWGVFVVVVVVQISVASGQGFVHFVKKYTRAMHFNSRRARKENPAAQKNNSQTIFHTLFSCNGIKYVQVSA